jgi:hypothetical protein
MIRCKPKGIQFLHAKEENVNLLYGIGAGAGGCGVGFLAGAG